MKVLSVKILRAFVFGVIAAVVFCPTCFVDEEQDNFRVLAYYIVTFLIIWEFISFGVKYIDKKYSWITNPNRKLFANLLFIFLLFIPFNFIYVKLIFSGNPEIFHTYHLFVLNRLNIVIGIVILLYVNVLSYFCSWKSTMDKNREMENNQLSIQLKALKNQINPHFLFNNFNTLSQLIEEDKEKAQTYLYQLSKVYRYFLENNSNLVYIEKELEVLEAYLHLQKTKHTAGLQIEILYSELKNFRVPNFTLQMLVENAFKHNEVSKINPVTIKIYKEGNFLCVENNITHHKNAHYASSGIGLYNIMERCSLLMGKNIVVEDSFDKFIVKIPVTSL